MATVELRPLAPSTTSRVKVSWMVFTGTLFMTKVMFTPAATRPIQLKPADLNMTLGAPSRSSSGMVAAIKASVVPSLGATLNT